MIILGQGARARSIQVTTMDKLKDVQIIHLRPKDKVVAIYDPNLLNVEDAAHIHNELCKFFENRPVLGLFGTELKFIKEEEDNNAEDNFNKHLSSLM